MFMKPLLRVAVLATVAVAATGCTVSRHEGATVPPVIAPSSGNPSSPLTSAPPGSLDHVIPDTPFAGVTADQIVQAWNARWHPKIEVIQTSTGHVRRATVDGPSGHGTLQIDVEQRGAGTDPGAVVMGCVLSDPTAGAGRIKVTPAMLTELVKDCFSPPLSGPQLTTVTAWIISKKPADSPYASENFPGLHVYFMSSPAKFGAFVTPR